MEVKSHDGESSNFPPTEVTLNELNSNTEYEISVMTTTWIDPERERTVNSDFTTITSAITGNHFELSCCFLTLAST